MKSIGSLSARPALRSLLIRSNANLQKTDDVSIELLSPLFDCLNKAGIAEPLGLQGISV